MRRPGSGAWVVVKVAAALLCAGVVVGLGAGAGGGHASESVARAQVRPGRGAGSRHRSRPDLPGFDPRRHRAEGSRLVADLSDGSTAVLTLDPALEAHVESELERFHVPYAAVVAVEPSTGRVLAYVSYSSANPDASDLVLDATPPTASVFKIITAAALLDSGVSPGERVCYHGGSSGISAGNLEDSAQDSRCATLADALGSSINCVFAKLAVRHLDAARLERYAGAFGFGQSPPFDIRTHPSPGEVPDERSDRLEFARTSAGFWHMHMSPLHGALIAATVANGGRMPRAAIVERVRDSGGVETYRFQPEVYREVISRHTARSVAAMMERTVTRGTARRAFHDSAGRPFLPGIRIAGKTGTLSGTNPYRAYTWWVGFAPAEAPTIAVAALVVNTPRWRIKASYMARETLREYLTRHRSAAPASL